ncbi:PP2C family protein-serine/threonine phosphatase [Nocardiopsis composta]|uniref:Serine/threonine protein phosphatase PrpC n=1 Tax=Nocardiopsis composta TaxID=157465 RepID=A0A7W8QNX6_9ACTN|nr:protein phosphatase 2C domain-containing protein [Nocardiopsis composta]MBB5433942.1 serine/threonine protein phosphatase PrpC [Nocardiopsis composta]
MNGEETGTGADVLLTCPACEDVIGSEDEYCENCGHRLGEDPPEPEPGPEHEPAERDRIETALGPIAGVTDRGLRHERNEDAMAMLTPGSRSPAMIGVVCDGVSSSPRPDDASLVAAETGAAAVAEALRGGADHRDAAAAGLTRAAAAVAALAGPDGAPACTYVSASMPEGGGPVTIGWIGDSRAYWLPGPGAPGPARRLTRDDSWSTAMVEAGVLTAREAEESLYAHAITAWLGADSGEVDGHVVTVEPHGPGAIVICTDGLWNYAPEPDGLAAVLPGAHTDPIGAARAGVRFALDSGGRDNITVVVISVPEEVP